MCRTPLIKLIIAAFLINIIGPMPVRAGEVVLPVMPAAGQRVQLSQSFTPSHIKGISIHPDNALQFDFLIDQGEENLNQEQKTQEYNKLVKYFLASLTIPDADQWVNLSPFEKNRIIQSNFGQTEMGRDLLAQDYFLKQITSSLMYPEEGLGKEFWDKVYERAYKEFGHTNIPVNTFNKVWIVPDQAAVYESGNTAYILKSHLKVMLEEDYLAKQKSGDGPRFQASAADKNLVGVIREVLIPELEREVNEGKNFAMLRQIYSAMIMATWYKRALKESLLGQIYADKAKVSGINQDPKSNDKIYEQYLAAFKKGVYNFIKEDKDKYTNQVIPRKYFAGGMVGVGSSRAMVVYNKNNPPDRAMLKESNPKKIDRAKVNLVAERNQKVQHLIMKLLAQAIKDGVHQEHLQPLSAKYLRGFGLGENHIPAEKRLRRFESRLLEAYSKSGIDAAMSSQWNPDFTMTQKFDYLWKPTRLKQPKDYDYGRLIGYIAEDKQLSQYLSSKERELYYTKNRRPYSREDYVKVLKGVEAGYKENPFKRNGDLEDSQSQDVASQRALAVEAYAKLLPGYDHKIVSALNLYAKTLRENPSWVEASAEERASLQYHVARRFDIQSAEFKRHVRNALKKFGNEAMTALSKSQGPEERAFSLLKEFEKRVGPLFSPDQFVLHLAFSGFSAKEIFGKEDEYQGRKFFVVKEEVLDGLVDGYWALGVHSNGLIWLSEKGAKALKAGNPLALEVFLHEEAHVRYFQRHGHFERDNWDAFVITEMYGIATGLLKARGKQYFLKEDKDGNPYGYAKMFEVLDDITIRNPLDKDQYMLKASEAFFAFENALRRTRNSREIDSLLDFLLQCTNLNQVMVLEDKKGGIDLNADGLNMTIKRDGKGVPLPLSQQDMNALRTIEGFEPVIIQIEPAVNLPIFTELGSLA
jgi:hypothetical protein